MRTDIWTKEQECLAKQYAHADSLEFIEKVGKTKAAANSHFHYIKYPEKQKRKRKRHTREQYVSIKAPNTEMIKDAERRKLAVRSLTATICGDPPPGYSALDKKI